MSQKVVSVNGANEHYSVVKEELNGNDASLTSFTFVRGANVYAFSYDAGGRRRHTLVEAGDPRYKDRMGSILTESGIDPANIEKIIITHRHVDHFGLAHALAKPSKAKILVHANFKGFVEGKIADHERMWLRGSDPTKLKECDVEYLAPSDSKESISIGGVDFVSLVKPIEIGKSGSLRILACPESRSTHSPDQLLILYSPGPNGGGSGDGNHSFRPTDSMLFSGDLWLMVGPQTDRRMLDFSYRLRRHFFGLKRRLSGKGPLRFDATEQDAQAKSAVKTGFSLIRVKPGHGEEFLGSRIIPDSLLANRDLLFKLGYPINGDQSILSSKELASKISALMEEGYASFIQELLHWRELGYSLSEVSELLVRIYMEQTGGTPVVVLDRQQRRVKMKETLARLRDDTAAPAELRQLAGTLRFPT